MRRIWRGWVVSYLPRLIGALLLMALVAGTASAYPLLTKYIVNALADGQAAEIIWLAPPVIFVFALVRGRLAVCFCLCSEIRSPSLQLQIVSFGSRFLNPGFMRSRSRVLDLPFVATVQDW